MNNSIFIIIAVIVIVYYLIPPTSIIEKFATNSYPHDADDLISSIDKLNKDISLKELKKTSIVVKKPTTSRKLGNNSLKTTRPKLSKLVTPSIDMDKYILKSKVPIYPNMDKFILKSAVPKCKPMADMSKYMLKTTIPDCPKPVDMDKYVLKSSMVLPTASKKTKKKPVVKKTAPVPVVKKPVPVPVVKKPVPVPVVKKQSPEPVVNKPVVPVPVVKKPAPKKYTVTTSSSPKSNAILASETPPKIISTYIPGTRVMGDNSEPTKCKIYKKVIRNADVYGAY
jgi:hypothetical protein